MEIAAIIFTKNPSEVRGVVLRLGVMRAMSWTCAGKIVSAAPA
jgi:hypothetical protein